MIPISERIEGGRGWGTRRMTGGQGDKETAGMRMTGKFDRI
jgi:hypothetical protein